jgi:hypothetical protein
MCLGIRRPKYVNVIQQNCLEEDVNLYNAKKCVGFTERRIFDYARSAKHAQYHKKYVTLLGFCVFVFTTSFDVSK